MTLTVTRLPDGCEVHHHSQRRFHVIANGRRVSSADERGRALAQWRKWRRNTAGDVWLISADNTVVRPITTSAS